MPVAELQARMSSGEFTEWIAYYQLEPFGPWRDDVRIGTLGAGLAGIMGDFRGQAKPKPEWFMPQFSQEITPTEPESPESMYRKLELLTAAMGGTVTHG